MSWQLIHANVQVLSQAERLLATLDDPTYGAVPAPATASIGGHLRHVVEFYRCFLQGLERGVIDYDDRARDRAVETERQTALLALAELKGRLAELDRSRAADPLAVRLDCAACGEEATPSSVARELQFLLSHTIHHYALIAPLVIALGARVDADFGIAPSTLEHRHLVGVEA